MNDMQKTALSPLSKKPVTVLRVITQTTRQVFVLPKAVQGLQQHSGKIYVV